MNIALWHHFSPSTLSVIDSKPPFTDGKTKPHGGEQTHPKPPRTRTQAYQALKPWCPWPPQVQQGGFSVTGEARALWISGETEAQLRVQAGPASRGCLPRRRPGQVPGQGVGTTVNRSSVPANHKRVG